MPELTCAACGAPMTEDEAMPAPDGVSIRYHAQFASCARIVMARHWERRREEEAQDRAIGAENGAQQA
jgi:hypothetical protein